MKEDTKGMMLLEVILSVALFSLFTISLWTSFQKIYQAGVRATLEVNQHELLQDVLAFISEEVQGAEGVSIQTEKGVDVMNSKIELENEKIKSITFIPRKQKTKGDVDLKEKVLSSVKKPSGYEISYQGVLVAEGIEALSISKEKDQNWVSINCSIEGDKETLTQKLSIDLGYKGIAQ